MVFCNTQRNTDFIANMLEKHGIDAVAIHGGLSQARRNKVMEHFRSERVGVLVCTDVAARGLDIKNVSHVYNYDISANSKEYIHRIGRTARAGKDGIAISIVSARDYENFRMVLKNPELNIDKVELPQIEKVFVQFSGGGGRGGSREGYGGGREYGRGRSESSGRDFRPGRFPRAGGRSGGRGYGGGRGRISEGRREESGDRRGRSEGRSSRGSGHGGSSRGGGRRAYSKNTQRTSFSRRRF